MNSRNSRSKAKLRVAHDYAEVAKQALDTLRSGELLAALGAFPHRYIGWALEAFVDPAVVHAQGL